MTDLHDFELEQDRLEHALALIQRLVDTGYLIRHPDGLLSSAPFHPDFIAEHMEDAK